MIIIIVVAGVSGAAGATLGADDHHRTQGHHHASLAGLVLAVVIVLGTLGLLAWLFLHARKQKYGVFAPQPIMGLKYRDRRTVLRDVRAGTPSPDPRLRYVETSTAERVVKYQRFSLIVFAFAFAGELFTAISRRSVSAHVFYALAAVMFISLFGYQRFWSAGPSDTLQPGTPEREQAPVFRQPDSWESSAAVCPQARHSPQAGGSRRAARSASRLVHRRLPPRRLGVGTGR